MNIPSSSQARQPLPNRQSKRTATQRISNQDTQADPSNQGKDYQSDENDVSREVKLELCNKVRKLSNQGLL